MSDRLTVTLERLRVLTDWGLWLAAAGTLSILAVRAAVSIDIYHDTWWYHLPWAARLAGLMPADSFVFSELAEQRYAGFPVLVEWLQGWLWRLSGRAEAANFVALGSLALFLVFLRLRFRVPTHVSLLALIAVPLIHVHATAAYVDLPANLALTTAILLLVPLVTPGGAVRLGDLALFLFACAFSANAKLQLVPAVAVVVLAGLIGLVLVRRRTTPRPAAFGPQILAWPLGLAFVVGVVFFVPLKNMMQFGNPLYPMALKVGPITLDGPQGVYLPEDERVADLHEHRRRLAMGLATGHTGGKWQATPPSGVVPPAIERSAGPSAGHRPVVANPVDWVRSVFEIGMEPVLGKGRWNIVSGQPPPLPARHGGYFGWYVMFHLAIFAVLIGRHFKAQVGILALFGAATLVAASLPVPNMLRYYMFWMILLVSLNLMLLSQAIPAGPATARAGPAATVLRLVALGGLVAFLLAVYATQAEFLKPRFYFMEDLIRTRRDAGLLVRVERHPAACLAGERPARVFLYASLFNPGHTYLLKTGPYVGYGMDEVPGACGPGWIPVIADGKDSGLLPAVP